MHISTKTQDDLIRWLFAAGAYFTSVIAFYIDIGEDMGPDYFLPLVIPVILALCLLQYGTRMPLFCRENLPNLLTGLGWCAAFPLLYAWTYEKCWFLSKISYDFIIGTGIFLMLTALEGLLMRTRYVKPAAVLMAGLNFLGLLVPFIQFAYYTTVWHCLSPASLMALYLTNYKESLDYIQSSFGTIPALLILAVIGLLLWRAFHIHCDFAKRLQESPATAGRTGVLAFLTASMFYVTIIWHLPMSSIAGLWIDVTTYVAQTQEYGQGHEARYATLDINPAEALPSKLPGTVIVVIGESASRNYMKAFTPSFEYEDTPWLSAQAENDDFLLFHNVYASWSQTVPVLQRALTEQSQYNEKDFLDSASIMDAAKKAGYETWWFSNQGRYGQFDSVITLVAKTADHAEWTDDSFNYSDKYDIALLDYLKKVDPTKNNFIVLHVMGSHIYYNNRYPSTFEKWKTADGTGMALATPSYANSILYTDHILSQVFDYAKENLNLNAMLYFSDHGENLEISHNPDVFSFDMVRIPMFLYLSPAYQEGLPERTRILRRHQESYFTNDMLYDTVCGLLNAPSNRYESRQDFSSADYAFSRESLTTMLGQHSLSEDPAAQ